MSTGIHIERRGKGDRLVLLHGWGLNLRVWDGVAAALADDFELVLVDLPGHGASRWSEGARTLEAQSRLVGDALRSATEPAHAGRPVTLMGWSLGGQIAIELARTMPVQLAALVLVATTPRFTRSPEWPAGLSPTVLQNFADQLRVDYRRTVADFLELQVRGSTSAAEVLHTLRAAILEHGEAQPAALEAGLDILAATDLRTVLPDVTVPALVIAGQYDRVTPPAAGRALAAALPAGRLVELRRAGHAPFLSHGDDFVREVRGFLHTLQARGSAA